MASAAARVETALPEPPARARRTRKRSALTGGVAWIVGIAALLAGVVAVNVSVLSLNVRLNEVERKRAALQAENAELAARVSSAASPTRIERLARKAGLVPFDPAAVVFVRLPRPQR
jgi:cell division protein FtsL